MELSRFGINKIAEKREGRSQRQQLYMLAYVVYVYLYLCTNLQFVKSIPIKKIEIGWFCQTFPKRKNSHNNNNTIQITKFVHTRVDHRYFYFSFVLKGEQWTSINLTRNECVYAALRRAEDKFHLARQRRLTSESIRLLDSFQTISEIFSNVCPHNTNTVQHENAGPLAIGIFCKLMMIPDES